MKEQKKKPSIFLDIVLWLLIVSGLLFIYSGLIYEPTEPTINSFHLGYLELQTDNTTIIIKDLTFNAEGLDNLINNLDEQVIYEDLYINIDDINETNPIICTKGDFSECLN